MSCSSGGGRATYSEISCRRAPPGATRPFLGREKMQVAIFAFDWVGIFTIGSGCGMLKCALGAISLERWRVRAAQPASCLYLRGEGVGLSGHSLVVMERSACSDVRYRLGARLLPGRRTGVYVLCAPPGLSVGPWLPFRLSV